MKKFERNEILNNTIKVYPKIKIFSYCGKHYYNNEAENGPLLNNFLTLEAEVSEVPPGALQTESEQALLTEDGDFIIIE